MKTYDIIDLITAIICLAAIPSYHYAGGDSAHTAMLLGVVGWLVLLIHAASRVANNGEGE